MTALTRRNFFQGAATVLAHLGIASRTTALSGPVYDAVPEEATRIWQTYDGREIRICDLEDGHLRNIIFYLNKRFGSIQEWKGWIDGGQVDPYKYLKGSPADLWETYDILRREANRRRLSWI